MTEKTTRRNFLQLLGLTAGTALAGTNVLATGLDESEILQLNPEQQAFMHRYEQWMDEYIDVIRLSKSNPGDMNNRQQMISLTERAEAFKPELNEMMKDKTFSLIYRISIERMTREI